MRRNYIHKKISYLPVRGVRGVVIVVVVVVVTVLSAEKAATIVGIIAVIRALRGDCHHYCKHNKYFITVLMISFAFIYYISILYLLLIY